MPLPLKIDKAELRIADSRSLVIRNVAVWASVPNEAALL